MMRSYMQRLYDSVDFSIDAVRRRSDWPAWRKRTLADLRRSLGLERFPPRTPLRARVVDVSDRDGYVLERVVFETRPGFLMTANLYRPKHPAGRVPAVLCVHGHTMKGKTSEAMQVRSINYARAGWVALALDATGHGERVHIGHRRTFAIVTAGMTLEGVQVWDNMRGIDYLRSRPEVDPERIGITGCSGGGNQTMYTAAVDEKTNRPTPNSRITRIRLRDPTTLLWRYLSGRSTDSPTRERAEKCITAAKELCSKTFLRSFFPGENSTTELTSTASGKLSLIASATFSQERPPARIRGDFFPRSIDSCQFHISALPPGRTPFPHSAKNAVAS